MAFRCAKYRFRSVEPSRVTVHRTVTTKYSSLKDPTRYVGTGVHNRLNKKRVAITKSVIATRTGAGDEARTRYLHLGKVALYQMSYTRVARLIITDSVKMSTLF